MIKDKAKWEFDAVRSLISVGILINQKQDLSFEYSNIPDGFVPPTKEEIDAEVKRLQAEYDAQEYARKREAEYPSIQECVHAILDDQLDALQAKRASIKTKYPKGD